jgi:hypothetical protein
MKQLLENENVPSEKKLEQTWVYHYLDALAIDFKA